MPKPLKTVSSGNAAEYAVGYAKPPAKNQFKAGESGNLHGSSKKRRALKADAHGSALDHILLKEANRKIAINENGVRSEITTDEAIVRKLAIGAVKGDRASQKEYLDRTDRARERLQKDRNTRFGLLVQYEKERLSARALGSISSASPVWPDPADLAINYRDCTGEVVGPVDAQQAEPFIALVDDYHIWQARLAQLQIMAGQATGQMQTSYPIPISVIIKLLATISHYLPPSFKDRLQWDDGPIPEGSLNIEGLHTAELVDFSLLLAESDEMAYALCLLVGAAMSASAQVRRLTKLDIATNTEILINRLRTERANRDDGAPPPIAAIDFGDFYQEFVEEPDENPKKPEQ